MKILKEGIVPPEKWWILETAGCLKCGVKVQFEERDSELFKACREQVRQVWTVRCPTEGCGETIVVRRPY